MYKFASASPQESIVFGSTRPGFKQVQAWIEFMQSQEIKRICCLLATSQLVKYANLLETYQQTFGTAQICWAPIEDFHLVSLEVLLSQVLPFLIAADQNQEKVVVHCSGGIGRTGQILAAWLVAGRYFSPQSAIVAVKQTGRNPYEAVIAAPFNGNHPREVLAELNKLLDECKGFRNRG
jgi:protein-tyrosine phosphatase